MDGLRRVLHKRQIRGLNGIDLKAGHLLDSLNSLSVVGAKPDLAIGLICERELEGYPILGALDSRNVAFPSDVFDEVDVPGPNGDLFSSRDFDLSLTAQRDHVLTTWGAMPIGNTTGRTPMELGRGDLLHLGDLVRGPSLELHFHLFGMRLIV